MKKLLLPVIIVSWTLLSLATQALADRPRPRPAFMPSTPSAEREIVSYSAAEIVGAVVTIELPNNHPFNIVSDLGGLKTTWPRARDNTQIDAMVQLVLDAPAETEHHELHTAFGNVQYVIRNVMDVSDEEKADAFVRLVSAQSDLLKRKRAATFAWSMFHELLDPRLLAFGKDSLDDATQYPDPVLVAPEGTPRRMTSTRTEAKRYLLTALRDTLKIPLDVTPYWTADEAANCAALKAWLTTNWPQIESTCSELRAAPDRQKPTVNIQVWDARW